MFNPNLFFKNYRFSLDNLAKSNNSFECKINSYHQLLIEETGSISLLIISFFIATLSALMVITDVAVVANAKRSLDHATEAAAMRAVHNLDEAAYYKGKHTILTSVWEIAKDGTWADNRVPIDCDKGRKEVMNEMNSWIINTSNMKTLQIQSFEIENYECVYDVVRLKTSATVKLPFPAPFTDVDRTKVNSSITTLNEKDKGFYLFGIRLH